MLKISEIKGYISTATDLFLETYPDFVIPKIIVCSSSRRQAIREKVIAECGLEYKEDMYGTSAEVIAGPLDMQVILYQSMVKTENQVRHALWHEFGHIMFGSEEQFNVNFEIDTPMRSGYAVVNEFMAEFIAYTVNKHETFSDSQKAHIYLQMAFENNTVITYWFSRYLAVILGDKNLSDEDIQSGKQYVLPEAWGIVKVIINELSKKIREEEFWKVSPEFLETIGELYDELFHICYTQTW